MFGNQQNHTIPHHYITTTCVEELNLADDDDQRHLVWTPHHTTAPPIKQKSICYRLLDKSLITIGIAPEFDRIKVEFGLILIFWSRSVGFSKDIPYINMILECRMSIRGVKHVIGTCMHVLGGVYCDKVVKNVVKSVVKSVV